jgi:hypothetical protein
MRPTKGIDVRDRGSTACKRQDLGHGFGPEAYFDVRNEARIGGKSPFDLTGDPPLDQSMSLSAGGPHTVQHLLTWQR